VRGGDDKPRLYFWHLSLPRWLHQVFMTTTRLSHPSAYAAHRTSSSKSLLMGTMAPCRTGLARTGVRRLGNKFGKRVCSAVPKVWGCPAVDPMRPLGADELVEPAAIVGGTC